MPARYDIFLSYSRADTALVAPLRDELRRRGYRVFFDTQSIDPGERWKDRLDRAIRQSRTLILCWSAHTRGSDYITFEYSRAEALHKPIYPWLLDGTALPAMLEIQGIPNPDALQVVDLLAPKLGWTLARRRTLEALAAVLLLCVAGIAAWRLLHPPPPPPWEFQGQVTDRVTAEPIAGVEVDAQIGNASSKPVLTDARGHYELQLPPPRPKTIQILFRKNGYQAENPLFVPTTKPFDMDMAKIP